MQVELVKKAYVLGILDATVEQEELDPNRPIPVKLWNDMLQRSFDMFGYKSEKLTTADYADQAADGEYITRDKAVASLMKLFPNPLETTQEQRNAAELAFKDYQDSSYQDSLAQAKHQGIVTGYNGMFYPKRNITVAEAVMLICRLIDRL